MSMQGFFHDAHEVYRVGADGERSWVATFSTRDLAEEFVKGQVGEFEVEPV